MENQKLNFDQIEATVAVEPGDNQNYGYVSSVAPMESCISYAAPIDKTIVESQVVPPTSVNSYYTPARPGDEDSHTMPIAPAQKNVSWNNAPQNAAPQSASSEEYTMPVMAPSIDRQPTIGWLVCIKGESRGMDYRLYGDYSIVGRQTKKAQRGAKLTVAIPDSTASADGNIRIAFDRRNRVFYVEACDHASNMSYLNNQPIFAATPLKANDIISIGNSDLLFVPLCSEQFSWEEGMTSVE